ncbi:hypothetical protein TIFTF001_034304 [Ficus carica]|uniref:Ubiquitin-like protease family profile domain-containing protein n=1 Tax=Ficus carica TaxID=3494 RepID=A0AA88DZI0_FICCA|nr:hypothetical protein TIFTF001_034304 [Ficus carica]
MPNASKKCQLFLTDLVSGGDVLVAIGRAYMDCVPTDTIHMIPLSEENVRVTITVSKLKRALLPIPMNEATCNEEAVDGYLANCCARAGMDQRFEFISLVLVSLVQQNVDRVAYIRERAENILRILRNAPKGKLFLMPYNSGQYWILAVIDPWDDSILYFNPLGNEPDDDFKNLIMMALNDWKLLVGRGIRMRRNCETLIDTVRCPI